MPVPPQQGKKDFFLKGKRKVGAYSKQRVCWRTLKSLKYSGFSGTELWESLIGWALARQGKLFFLLGSATVTVHESSPFWLPNSILIEVSLYQFCTIHLLFLNCLFYSVSLDLCNLSPPSFSLLINIYSSSLLNSLWNWALNIGEIWISTFQESSNVLYCFLTSYIISV